MTSLTHIDIPPETKRTPWLPAMTFPHRPGAYEVVVDWGYYGWAWWTGTRWGECYPWLESAVKARGFRYQGQGFHQVREWRGCLQRQAA